jgi:hypothetical protein
MDFAEVNPDLVRQATDICTKERADLTRELYGTRKTSEPVEMSEDERAGEKFERRILAELKKQDCPPSDANRSRVAKHLLAMGEFVAPNYARGR